MKLNVTDIKGKKVKSLDASDAIWAVPMNRALLAQAVHVISMNSRHAPAQAKTRAEVSGSDRKLWKQKGTGRARHGDRLAPQFVHGGVAHGPTGDQNYHRTINKKMRQKAFFSILSHRLLHRQVVVLDRIPVETGKTGDLRRALSGVLDGKRALLVVGEESAKLARACRNLASVTLRRADQLNTLDIFRHRRVILTAPAVTMLDRKFSDKSRKRSVA